MTLDQLEQLASRATPGPWSLDRWGQVITVPAPNGIRADLPVVCPAGRYDSDPALIPEDAAYIAALSPDVALALIRVARAAEEWRGTIKLLTSEAIMAMASGNLGAMQGLIDALAGLSAVIDFAVAPKGM